MTLREIHEYITLLLYHSEVADQPASLTLHFPDGDRQVERADKRFAEAYDRLAEDGVCDSWGGLESDRVFRQWLAAGKPDEIDGFIRQHANDWGSITGG